MKKFQILFALLTIFSGTKAQDFNWEMSTFGFADNREYESKVQIPQSILGIQFIPKIGLTFDTVHGIWAGANVLQEFGSNHFPDNAHPYLYYKFDGKLFHFNFGSFSRFEFLAENPRLLYYDSLLYYRPYINGIFWTLKQGNFSQSVYLDWTSRQTDVRRETFIMGTQGKFQSNFYFIHNYLYMYHFAGPGIPLPDDHVRDNGVAYIRLGLDFSHKTLFDSLSVCLSGVRSFERIRDVEQWNTPQGFLIEFNAEYKGYGISNIFYKGDGHNLDWGDPYYRLNQYNRVDFYFTPLNFRRVKGRFNYSFHIAEGNFSHQQQFLLTIDLNKIEGLKVPAMH